MHDLGKMHDPKDHATVSAEMYANFGGDPLGAHLIANDMVIHCLPANACGDFMKEPHWPLLYLIGLAAINANSIAWGKDSTNFKIKKKHFEQRAKRLLKDNDDRV